MNTNKWPASSFVLLSVIALALSCVLPVSAAATSPSSTKVQTPKLQPQTQNPAVIPESHTDTAFIQVLAGQFYSAALREDGTVWTWGRNLYGELGLPGTSQVFNINAPVRLSTLTDISSITTSGNGYQLALKKDGTVWEWGAPVQEGQALSRDWQAPKPLSFINNVEQVISNSHFSLAVKKDGTVWGWNRSAARETDLVQLKGLSKTKLLTSDNNYIYSLDETGKVCFLTAEHQDGQLNFSATAAVEGLPALKQISAAENTLYGIDHRGRAWKWVIGVSASGPRLAGKPEAVYPELRIADIQPQRNYALVLTQQGEVWIYGKSPTGKTGKTAGLKNIVSISAGPHHMLASDGKGQLWGWGGNKRSELGLQLNYPSGMIYKPVLIPPAISVILDGKMFNSPFPAVMNGGRIRIPLKDTAAALGLELTVHPEKAGYRNVYTLKSGSDQISFYLDDKTADYNGKQVTLSESVVLYPGTTMIPASMLQHLGFHVSWDRELSQLSISRR